MVRSRKATGHVDERFFRCVDKFSSGDGGVWSELHHQFKTKVVTANVEIRRKLDEIQEGGLALDRDVIFVDDEQEFGDKRRTMSATFFDGLGNQ